MWIVGRKIICIASKSRGKMDFKLYWENKREPKEFGYLINEAVLGKWEVVKSNFGKKKRKKKI